MNLLEKEKEIKATKGFIKSHNRSRIINLVFTTLIFSGPPLWLILRIYDRDIEKLMSTAIVSFFALIYITFTWCHFFFTRKEIKQSHENLSKEVMEK